MINTQRVKQRSGGAWFGCWMEWRGANGVVNVCYSVWYSSKVRVANDTEKRSAGAQGGGGGWRLEEIARVTRTIQ